MLIFGVFLKAVRNKRCILVGVKHDVFSCMSANKIAAGDEKLSHFKCFVDEVDGQRHVRLVVSR